MLCNFTYKKYNESCVIESFKCKLQSALVKSYYILFVIMYV